MEPDNEGSDPVLCSEPSGAVAVLCLFFCGCRPCRNACSKVSVVYYQCLGERQKMSNLCFLFFINAVKILVCDCVQFKSFSMECHLCMHVLTKDGLWKGYSICVYHSHTVASPSSLESFWSQISPCNLQSLWWSSNIQF